MSARPHDWSAILVDAVTKPGFISKAYSTFWHYSTGNQLLAMFQCLARSLEVGPINTFRGWLGLGRHVKKGEKAITLCMPVTVKRNADQTNHQEVVGGDGAERPSDSRTIFVFKPHWFVLSQTNGAEYVPQELPEWNETLALHRLLIERENFIHPDGNCQGYAIDRQVAVSPIAALPWKTLFHELAHIMLGHTTESGGMVDHDQTPTNIREVEAEGVALICCESLALPGSEFCRGYIQRWLAGEKISDASAQRIFKAADAILKAGHPASEDVNA
jgi:antirestriction protein ArdC